MLLPARLPTTSWETARRVLFLLILLLLMLFFLVVPGVSWVWADTTETAAFARRVAAAIPKGSAARVSIQNEASVTAIEFAEMRATLEVALRESGVRAGAAGDSATLVAITLSESPQGLLWIAQVGAGDARQVVIERARRPEAKAGTAAVKNFLLRKTFLTQQTEPILDAQVVTDAAGGAATLLVLFATRVESFGPANGAWEQREIAVVPAVKAWSRDRRGRILVQGEGFTIQLPGVACRGDVRRLAEMACSATSADANAIRLNDAQGEVFDARFVAGRNYFLYSLPAGLPDSSQPVEVYSGARWVGAGGASVLLMQTDGLSTLYEKGFALSQRNPEWGSDVAVIRSGCGAGVQLLTTQAGDWTAPDAVQALEIQESRPVTVSAPVHFGGPVVALWTAASGESVTSVVQNLKTGWYEAYSLTISCAP